MKHGSFTKENGACQTPRNAFQLASAQPTSKTKGQDDSFPPQVNLRKMLSAISGEAELERLLTFARKTGRDVKEIFTAVASKCATVGEFWDQFSAWEMQEGGETL